MLVISDLSFCKSQCGDFPELLNFTRNFEAVCWSYFIKPWNWCGLCPLWHFELFDGHLLCILRLLQFLQLFFLTNFVFLEFSCILSLLNVVLCVLHSGNTISFGINKVDLFLNLIKPATPALLFDKITAKSVLYSWCWSEADCHTDWNWNWVIREFL